jgi:hypothetical protein
MSLALLGAASGVLQVPELKPPAAAASESTAPQHFTKPLHQTAAGGTQQRPDIHLKGL